MTTEFIIWYHHQTWKKHVSTLLFLFDWLFVGEGKRFWLFDWVSRQLTNPACHVKKWNTVWWRLWDRKKKWNCDITRKIEGKSYFNEIRDLCPVWISNATVTQALFDGKKGDCNPLHDGFKGEDGYQRPITHYRGLMKSHNVFRLFKPKPLSNG